MKSWLIGEKSGFTRMGVSLVALAAGIVAVMAFINIVTPLPGSAAGDVGAPADNTSSMVNASIPDTVPSANETPDTTIDTAPGYGMGRIAKHIAYASQPNVSDIVVYTAYWTVPERPAYDEYIKHTLFLWCGLQQGNLGLIQPVLEWDHDDTGKYWTLACWIVNKRDNTYEVGQRLNAYPGDRIRADLRYITDPDNPGRMVWYIAISDLTQQSMAYLLDYGGAVDTNQDLSVFSGVLEGTDLVRYDVDLPGDVTFGDVICKAEGGVDVPLNLTGFVHPDMGQVAIEYEDGPSVSPVIIHTHYNGQ
jgi:hypothetical protein